MQWVFVLVLSLTSAVSWADAGLVASYFNNKTLTGPPVMVRIDSTINFNWGTGVPGPQVNADGFSVRWTGILRVPTTGSYTFQTSSDDGSQSYLNGALLTRDWSDHAARPIVSSPVTLTAGVDYPLVMEYYDTITTASVQLAWKKPGDSTFSVVPSSNGTFGLSTGLTPLMEYHFEEASWDGSIGEVLDSSGNGWDGSASGLYSPMPTTASGTPAIPGSTGTCRYGSFKRSNKDYIALSSNALNLGSTSGFTVSLWIRATDSSLIGQRIFADDENGRGGVTVGYMLSLGDQGTGKLSFVGRSSTTITTPSVITNNTWYFVVFGVDFTVKNQFIQVFNTSGTQLASVSASISGGNFASDSGIMSIGAETNLALGGENTSSFGFGGNIDEVRVYPFLLTAAEISTVRTLTYTCATPLTLVAEYRFEDANWNGTAGELKDAANYPGGPFNGAAIATAPLPIFASASPARSGNSGTCGYATMADSSLNQGSFAVSGLPLPSGSGAQTTLAFWMYWNSIVDNVLVAGFNNYSLWIYNGYFGFNSGSNDNYAASASGLSNGWHHVIAVFSNSTVGTNQLYVDGMRQALSQRGPVTTANLQVSNPLRIGTVPGINASTSTSYFKGRIDDVQVYSGTPTSTEVAALYALTHVCAPHHLEIRHSNGNGLTCTPSTVTLVACLDSTCATPHTGGVTGTLSATGTGMTVNWPAGNNFTIPSGSSTVNWNTQITTVGSVTLGAISSPSSTLSATTCNFGTPSCTFTSADSGLLFDVPNHYANVAYPFTVTAVRKSDNSASCTPAFANVTQPVTFKCNYSEPVNGTLPLRIGGVALNSGNNASAACDGVGRAVSLTFDANGVASTSAQYADVGKMAMTGTYTGSGADAGLVMTGSDIFVTAPYGFAVSGLSGPFVAGNVFNATFTATNFSGATTPNFGREATPESAALGFIRTSPTGSGASNGTFSGSLSTFAGGSATATNLTWSEVGRGDLSAVLASGSYLGSGLSTAGSSAGTPVFCANDNGTCALPAGATATVFYGAAGRVFLRSSMSGSIACNSAVFGDPYVGNNAKICSYVVTSGSSSSGAGAAGNFQPHHLDVAVTPACMGTFTYSGQPFTTMITARNAGNATTVNYDGTSATSPNYARDISLGDAMALGVGGFNGTNVAAANLFNRGVAITTTPTYTYTNKLTSEKKLVVRAVDTNAVSSIGYMEGSTMLRSGRLRLSNAFGSEKSSLTVPAQAQYWSGQAWVLNGADSCTMVPAAAVSRAAYLDNRGAATSAWSTTASAIGIAGGMGVLTLSAPLPLTTGSVDLALNLGNSSLDQSCLTTHPASTAAGLPWLRSQNGGCSTLWDRDPAARASFGIFTPETRKIIHVRELF